MAESRSRVLSISIFFLLTGICLLLVVGVNFLLSMPTQAEILFGSPANSSALLSNIYNSTYLIINQNSLTHKPSPSVEEIVFEILPGETAQSTAVKLEKAGLIPHAGAFVKFLQYKGYDRVLIARQYLLSGDQTPIEIAESLRNPEPEFIPIVIYPGLRYEEFASLFERLFVYFEEAQLAIALKTAAADANLNIQSDQIQTYAALFLPGDYSFHRSASAEEISDALISDFSGSLSDELRAGLQDQGLSLEEGLILASIIQREALHTEEMPMIASVFLNRLAVGMKLEADPTVQYALGYQSGTGSWWKSALTFDDLAFNSPYNTYASYGLPPSPICNPSPEALVAVAFPEISPYYFFRTTCDNSGYHTFAETYDEHVGNACP